MVFYLFVCFHSLQPVAVIHISFYFSLNFFFSTVCYIFPIVFSREFQNNSLFLSRSQSTQVIVSATISNKNCILHCTAVRCWIFIILNRKFQNLLLLFAVFAIQIDGLTHTSGTHTNTHIVTKTPIQRYNEIGR